jgi:L-threonylcarbamoyladenylate synthase
VYKSKGTVSSAVSCGLDSLAIRIPSNIDAQRFLKTVDLPIAAPSANTSKHISPVSAEHVFEDLCGKIPLILDGGRCTGGIESTVLDVTSETPIILRSGLVTYDMIVSVVGKCEYAQHKEGDKIKSPGVKYKHYSPKCKTVLFERGEWESAANEYRKAEDEGLHPIIICDDAIKEYLTGFRVIGLGKTSADFASNIYFALHEGEKISDYIIGIEVEGDSQVDVGVMNRFSKACKE